MWNKIRLLFQAFETGFDLAIWLDADTLVVDPLVSLRDAVGEFGTIGMVKHPKAWRDLPWHFNTGVIFARNLDATKAFLHEVWKRGDSEHPWWEQNRVMEVLRDHPDAVQEIDRRWNSQPNCNPCEEPVIRAWHGLRNRLASMTAELREIERKSAVTFTHGQSSIDSSVDKYFQEAGDGHYDRRFYNGEVSPDEKRQVLCRLLATLVSACARHGVQVVLMHGALIGWHWNRRLLPWDTDIDVSVLLEELPVLEKIAREGFAGTRTLLEINPHSADRTSLNRDFRENRDPNKIDARMIDVETGLFIDITALASIQNGKRATKCVHVYEEKDLFPLQPSSFEGVEILVPANVINVITQEYGPLALQIPYYANHYFNIQANEWLPSVTT